MMRDNNKGFSLVEIIIVVAIIALFTSIAGYGLSLSSGKAADECAQKLAASIQRARTSSMGKYKTRIKITKDPDGVWAQELVTTADKSAEGGESTGEVEHDRVKIGDKNVTVDFEGSPLSEVIFEFDRGSGALKGYNSSAVISFTISKASKTKTVEIVPLTGKVTAK